MKYLILILSACFVGSVISQKDFKNDEHFVKYLQKQLAKSEKHSLEYSNQLKGSKCRAELRILRRIVEEGQPQLYRYATRKQIDSAFSNLYKNCKRNIGYKEYLKGLSGIQYTIGAGHSGYTHSPGYVEHAKKFEVYFPFDIRYDGEDCKIYHNCSAIPRSLLKDDIVLVSVNSKPIDDIITEIRNTIDRDGNSNSRSHQVITKSFGFFYSDFLGTPQTFNIEYIDPDSQELKEMTTDGLTLAEIYRNRADRYMIQKREVLSSNFDGNKAYLGIHTFWLDQLKENQYDYKYYTREFFKKVEELKINELYIDLRGNRGGHISNASYLLSYLIQDTMDYIEVEVKKVNDFSYEPLLKNWIKYPTSIRVDTIGSKYFMLETPIVQPAKNYRYTGNLYLITDNLTQSCAASICSLLRSCSDAVFIGEETGSPRVGSSGNPATVQLPHSKIKYTFPQSWSKNIIVGENEDARGVIPDIPINRKPIKFYDWDFYMNIVEKYNRNK